MDRMNAETEAYTTQQVGPLQQEHDDCEALLTYAQSSVKHTNKRIESKYRMAVSTLRYGINCYRQDAGLDSIDYDNIPIAPLNLDEPVIVPEKDPAPSTAESQRPLNGHSKVRSNGQMMHGITALVLSLMLSACGGYSTPEPLQELPSKALLYMGDWSVEPEDITQLPPIEDQIAAIFDMLAFAPQNDPLAIERAEITVIAGHIGQTSYPAFYAQVMPGDLTPERDMVKAKRRQVQNEFISAAGPMIGQEFKAEGLPQSYVIPCLCEGLRKLMLTEATEKYALIVSDLIQNDPQRLSFYKYGADLMDHYEEIADKADKLCPALQGKIVTDTKFTAVYLPNPRDDRMALATRDFFMRWLGGKGIDIKFQPNLPRSTAISSHVNHYAE